MFLIFNFFQKLKMIYFNRLQSHMDIRIKKFVLKYVNSLAFEISLNEVAPLTI